MRRSAIVPLMLLALAGCTQTTTCQVVSFHQLPPPAGETISVAPAEPALAGSPQYIATVAMVAQHLAALGYRPVEPGEDAVLTARIGYGIEGHGTQSLTLPPCSFDYRFGIRRLDDPYWYGYRCHPRQPLSAALYLRHLETQIVAAGGEVLFDGRVQSVGSNDSLADVLPYLVAAMFTNFPGESGAVKTVTIEHDSPEPALEEAGGPACLAPVQETSP